MRAVVFLVVSVSTVLAQNNVKVTSAASASVGVAPGGLATISGLDVKLDNGAFPIVRGAGGLSIRITDSQGGVFTAPMTSVYSSHVEFEVPEGAATGNATVEVNMASGSVSAPMAMQYVAPALFAVNDEGVAAATAVRDVLPTHAQGPVDVFKCVDTPGSCRTVPIDVGIDAPVYVTFYGTGIRGRRSLDDVLVTIGSEKVKPLYAGPQPQTPGLDQVNVMLPLSLHGAGEVNVTVTVDGFTSNPVKIAIQ